MTWFTCKKCIVINVNPYVSQSSNQCAELPMPGTLIIHIRYSVNDRISL